MRPLRVTVIDDADAFREMLTDVLVDGGHQVTSLGGPTYDWQLLASEPDVLFLDLRLSRGNEPEGWNLLKAIRRSPVLRTLPVIVSSADAAALKRIGPRIARMGDTFSLSKPFTLDELDEILERATDETRAPNT